MDKVMFYDGSDGWANGDLLFIDPTGSLWTPQSNNINVQQVTVRSLTDSTKTLFSIDKTGWRSLWANLGRWVGSVYLSKGSLGIQAPRKEQSTWTDVTAPELDGGGPEDVFGFHFDLEDCPEMVEHWDRQYAKKWSGLRSSEWIEGWVAKHG